MGTMNTQTGSDMAKTAERVAHNVQELSAGVKDRALHVKEKYVDVPWSRTRDYTRDNPGKAILASAAVGVLLGMLWRRRP